MATLTPGSQSRAHVASGTPRVAWARWPLGRRVPNSNSAFHVVTSGARDRVVRCGCRATRRAVVGQLRRHPQPPQLPLPVRCLVSDAAAGYRPGPVAVYLPEVGGDYRRVGEPGFRPEEGNRILDEPFELSGVQRRAQGELPQLPKIATSSQLIDIKRINQSGRGLDEVQKERRIRAEWRMRGR